MIKQEDEKLKSIYEKINAQVESRLNELDLQSRIHILEAASIYGWAGIMYQLVNQGDELNYPFGEYLLLSLKYRQFHLFDVLMKLPACRSYLDQITPQVIEAILVQMSRRYTDDLLFMVIFKDIWSKLKSPSPNFYSDILKEAKNTDIITFIQSRTQVLLPTGNYALH
jgi:hypothetical protein